MARLKTPLYRKAVSWLAANLHPSTPPELSLAVHLVAFLWDRPLADVARDVNDARGSP